MSDPAPTATDIAELAGRLARWEAVEQIKELKHRYFRACDAKDPRGFRECFIAGAPVDYGELGSTDAEGMAAVFESIALQQVEGRHVILDMHHGMHASIDVHDDSTATGRWTLRFRQVNLIDNTETVTSGEYDDDYLRRDGQWKMSACRFRRNWSITRPIDTDCRITQ